MRLPWRRNSHRCFGKLAVLVVLITSATALGVVAPLAGREIAAQPCSAEGSDGGGAACPQADTSATVKLAFSPSGSAQLGADVTVRILTSDPDLVAVKIALGCGSPAVYELAASAATFT